MFSDEETKPLHESFMRPGDEIISIREVCLNNEKCDKKVLGFNSEALLAISNKNDLDVSRSLFRESFFPDGLEPQQASFAWTEEDGNIATLVSEHGFGTTSQTMFGKDLDAAFKSELKEADTSSSILEPTNHNKINLMTKPFAETQLVSSTSTGNFERAKVTGACKVDKTDPRSRVHYVKYVKRHGRTVKLWECGICSREFQHQYTLMRHLPTHTDERNFHCAACGKSFRQLSTLSQHRAIHSADRPYACEVCNKTFNRVSTLISHRKTHSDEKPYRCHLCPKGFHQKGNLRNHLFTHTNERPYRCNICYKGFNQQSNLVCHKNKVHSDDSITNAFQNTNLSQACRLTVEIQPKSSRNTSDHCEVSSSVGPHLPPPVKDSLDFCIKLGHKAYTDQNDLWNDKPWSTIGGGVIVNPIKTYHMGVALATKQTPFALLKPENCDPVLVKVVDTKLPGGKQMLVPATAEDLRTGGKIVMKNEDGDNSTQVNVESEMKINQAVQIRVPVVAIVVPRMKDGERLHLAVEEPHHAYHTALSADGKENNSYCAITTDPCTSKSGSLSGPPNVLPRLEPRPLEVNINCEDRMLKAGEMSSSCALSPPAPSLPFDFISMDLFEPMECMPLGPQITTVDNIDQPPPSDDSDIFIGEFEESIPLTDSD